MIKLNNFSITQKLFISIFFTGDIVALLACAAFIINDRENFRNHLINNATITGNIIGFNSSSALEFQDTYTVTETLKSLSQSPHVEAAVLYTRDTWKCMFQQVKKRPYSRLEATASC